MHRWARWTTGLVVVAAIGCGGSSGGTPGGQVGNCMSVAACGGNLVGTWKIVDSCSAGTLSPNPSCPGETTQVSSLSVSGTYVFNGDGTYSASLSETASETITIPTSCLSTSTIPVTCDELSMGLTGPVSTSDDAGTGSTTGMCTTANGSCNCGFRLSLSDAMGRGTYATSGDTVTLDKSNASEIYCVSGSTLYLLGVETDAGTTGTGYVVATKQ
jgi:hypothetical protein